MIFDGLVKNVNNKASKLLILQRQLSELADKFQAQEVEINRLKENVKQLEEREGVAAINSGDNAPIKGRSMDERDATTERIDAQVARELEEQVEKEDQTRAEQIARDDEIARIHAEEELQNGEPATSESPKLNPKDLTARLEDIKVEIDTLHADREDKEVLISELQDSLAATENEIAVLQLRVDDAEARQAHS
nr:hypothetical protein [Tanacetum cinerariifolium]